MKLSQKNCKRIVVKIGSSLIYANNKLHFEVFEEASRQIAYLIKEGKEIIVVSSGAIALGMHLLRMKERPKELSSLQAVAAIGQNEMMNSYRKFLGNKGLNAGQVLLTWEDFNDRKRYLNAKNTLLTLLKLRGVPIVNENDTVSTDEIKFGDNDRLSALVSTLVSADLLIILSDVDGLLNKEKALIKIVDGITPGIRGLACPTSKKTCVGGMITKIEAAKIATDSGIPCIIANGRRKGVILTAVAEPSSAGTLFMPKNNLLAAKKRWIAFGAKPKGKIIVDDGAKKALLNKKSLLSVGVVSVEGNFDCGNIVSLLDKQNCEFARGRVNISNKHLEEVKGARADKEVIHCDNIVIL